MKELLQPRGVSQVRGLQRDRIVEATVEPNQAGATLGAREKGGEGPKLAAKGEFKTIRILSGVRHLLCLLTLTLAQ